MKKFLFIALFLLCNSLIFSNIPASVVLLRDTMYNDPLNHTALNSLYEDIIAELQSSLNGYDLYVALSRCEYYMGRSYAYADEKEKAGMYYDKGLEYAEKALDINKGYEALLMYGEHISQNCAVKSTSYAIANGLKVGRYAKDVLKLQPKNAAAMYLSSAQHVYAPSPFHNYRKGISEMTDILNTSGIILAKDDEFNVTSAIAYAHMQRKEYDEALTWIAKALELYPSNIFALALQQQINDAK
ncbi:MAG: tetratricopeptide repeat protein [Spirochaetales bacterium]